MIIIHFFLPPGCQRTRPNDLPLSILCLRQQQGDGKIADDVRAFAFRGFVIEQMHR